MENTEIKETVVCWRQTDCADLENYVDIEYCSMNERFIINGDSPLGEEIRQWSKEKDCSICRHWEKGWIVSLGNPTILCSKCFNSVIRQFGLSVVKITIIDRPIPGITKDYWTANGFHLNEYGIPVWYSTT